LDIYVAHLVTRRPFNGVFKLQLAPNIHPDTVYQSHDRPPYLPHGLQASAGVASFRESNPERRLSARNHGEEARNDDD
jgi:hypothetical protein